MWLPLEWTVPEIVSRKFTLLLFACWDPWETMSFSGPPLTLSPHDSATFQIAYKSYLFAKIIQTRPQCALAVSLYLKVPNFHSVQVQVWGG